MNISTNAPEVARELGRVAVAAQAAVAAVVNTEGLALQAKVRANASGRPGPRAQTGDYRRSINLTVRTSGHGITAEVYSRAPQAWRLEMGFWGMTDSLGRLFHQPPYPHFQPAADEMEQRFPQAIVQVLDRALQETS